MKKERLYCVKPVINFRIIGLQNKFNKEQRCDMAKINRLLEERLELAEYEKVYGDLPSTL